LAFACVVHHERYPLRRYNGDDVDDESD
jgi:hypothetical protein